jgi:hypothetical protein
MYIPGNAQTNGEIFHLPEAIYQYAIGWFDWDVRNSSAIGQKIKRND